MRTCEELCKYGREEALLKSYEETCKETHREFPEPVCKELYEVYSRQACEVRAQVCDRLLQDLAVEDQE